MPHHSAGLIACAALCSALDVTALAVDPPHRFVDVTDDIGLGGDVLGPGRGRCCMADLNGDGFPDVIINRSRVFLNRPLTEDDLPNGVGRFFEEVVDAGLPEPTRSDLVVFADLNQDGNLDAIVTRYVDLNNENWEDHGRRTAWLEGRGDGTFNPIENPIATATPATTSAISVGDLNRDGHLDLWIGNWYRKYGGGYDGFRNDCLLGQAAGSFERVGLPSDSASFTETEDAAGRPTYGALIAHLIGSNTPELIELNYGRRWNRVYEVIPLHNEDNWFLQDRAPAIGLDGDAIRHGRHPDWLRERAKTDPRFDRADEKPFRANGNTFDAAINDFDNDGDFDIVIAEITHGWAGESSDRSRLMTQQDDGTFVASEEHLMDRIPEQVNNWNHGDLFCAMEDLDGDGRVDVLLSSGDYPDNQRLRFFQQSESGALVDMTSAVELDHDGSQQLSLGDINGDGHLDILVGQTFNRYTKEMREGRTPAYRVFLNEPPSTHHTLTLRLEGDPRQGCSRDAVGAIVTATLYADDVSREPMTMMRQLSPVGGHAGKQMDFVIHFGLGEASQADMLTITWPDERETSQVFTSVDAGRYTVRFGERLQAADAEP